MNAVRRSIGRRGLAGLAGASVLLGAIGTTRADELRDPMQPPPAARAAAAGMVERAASGAIDAAAAGWRPRYLIVSKGRHYLVHESRRYGVGDTFGSARIERIDDQAVWLREGARLTRLPMFGAVEKRPAKTTEAATPLPLGPREPAAPATPPGPLAPRRPALPHLAAARADTTGPIAPAERKERQP